jgi:hypothetical protein
MWTTMLPKMTTATHLVTKLEHRIKRGAQDYCLTKSCSSVYNN